MYVFYLCSLLLLYCNVSCVCAVGNLKEFRAFLADDAETVQQIKELSGRVEMFAAQFPMPGIDDL